MGKGLLTVLAILVAFALLDALSTYVQDTKCTIRERSLIAEEV